MKSKYLIMIAFLSIALVGCGSSAAPEETGSSGTFATVEQTEEISEYAIIDSFIEKYNKDATFKLENPTEIDIQDPNHYRVEYRLGAYKNAVAKQCSINGTTIDIVNYGYKNDSIRMYTYFEDENDAVTFFNDAPVLF